MIELNQALDQFRRAAEARGLALPDRLEMGALRRCGTTDKPKGKDGAYLLHLDGIPAGGCQNYRDGLGWQDWRADVGRSLTPEEERAHRERLAATVKAREQEEQARRDKARRQANELWKSAADAPADHAYLQAKGVGAHGLKIGSWRKWKKDDAGQWVEVAIPGALLVPARDARGTLRSLQAIFPEKIDGRNKDFLPGGQMAGCFHRIGELQDGAPLAIAEGYATAASIHELMGWPVAVAFDCHKLQAVAKDLRAKYPKLAMVICGDDDRHNPDNPGRSHAEAAAGQIGAAVAFPEFGPDSAGTDFNDLAVSHQPDEGPEALCRILGAAMGRALALVQTPAPTSADAAEEPTAPPEGDGFQVRESGVYRIKWVRGKGGAFQCEETHLCAPLSITHMVRDRNGDGWSRRVEFKDHDNRFRHDLLPDDLLEGDGLVLARRLRSKGLFVGDNKGGLLKMFVNSRRPEDRARLTRRIGWHEGVEQPENWSFVLPDDREPIAPADAELWIFDQQGGGHARFKDAGSLADWREQLAALAVGNSRLLFALSAGFAAGLAWLHPNIPGGFHWSGGSSLGKSALLYAVASLCGPKEYRRTWLLTAVGVEFGAAGHCDAPYLLDELKQSGNPREVAQAAYMLAAGQGKGRGQAGGGLRDTAEFRLLFQSNGEIGLRQFLQENGEKSYAGQEVRFCEIPGDAGAGFGCWENLHGHPDGARFSEVIQAQAARYYGTAYPEFLRHVAEKRQHLAQDFDAMRQKFEAAHLSNQAEGQVIRAATRFAACAFAGELATAWGITGWPPGAAAEAAGRLFRDWVKAFGGEGNQEPRRMVEGVREWLQRNAPSRLEDMRRSNAEDSHAPRVENRAGWKRPTSNTKDLPAGQQVQEFLIYPAVFKSELAEGFDPKQVAQELSKRGFLEHAPGRLMIQARVPGTEKPAWFYLIRPSILEGDGDAS